MNYKAFTTKMTFIKKFKGNLKVGKAEIPAKRAPRSHTNPFVWRYARSNSNFLYKRLIHYK